MADYIKEDYGNGFIFEQTQKDRINVDYCVSFDHKSKGYNDIKSQNATGSFTNTVGFNNYMNYNLSYSFSKWNNVWGWGSNEKDEISSKFVVKNQVI